MKTALVTGASGFIGRHMAAELDSRGYSVDVADIAMDIDAHGVFVSATWVYDLVVHAAAVSPHRLAIDTRPAIFPANVALDAAMFEWAIRTQQRRVLYFSSSAAYPVYMQHKDNPVLLREIDIGPRMWPDPDSHYGWTKLTGERMAQSAREAGVPVTVVRPFSGYGEDQSDDFPFRALIERARRQVNPYDIWGDGTQVRDWIHVDDVVAGALAVVDAEVDEPVNLCTGRGVSMTALATMACNEMGYRPCIHHLKDKPAGVGHRVGDPTVLHRYYTPRITLEEGVKRALA